MKDIKKPRIYCNNLECPLCKKLDEPEPFSWNKYNYTPFEDNKATGLCTRKGYDFMSMNVNTKNIEHEIAACHISEFEIYMCDREDCLHNENKTCTRKDIWVNQSAILLPTVNSWHCRCFSDKKFKGHRDWSSFLQPNKTAKGGHIDDKDAEKMYQDSLKFKSFKNGHHESREQKRKKS